MTRVHAFAAAKVNLDLRIVGRRDDGYHLLESLVVFASVGDRLEVTRLPRGAAGRISADGRTAGDLDAGPTTLSRAMAALEAEAGLPPGALSADVRLEKSLPVAAGLGGGSADAAALIRALIALYALDLDGTAQARAALAVGADVPACLLGQPLMMAGIGELLTPLPAWPTLEAVLVHPGVACSTPAVFAAYARSGAAFAAPRPAPLNVDTPARAIAWLAASRNDLEPAALGLAPKIEAALGALESAEGIALARMTGSGATCYGIFAENDAARAAATRIAATHSGWWVQACRLGAATDPATLAAPSTGGAG